MLRKLSFIPLLLLMVGTAYAKTDACDYRQVGPATATEQLTHLLNSEVLQSGALTLAIHMNEKGCLAELLLTDAEDTPRFVETLYEAYGSANKLTDRLKAAMLINALHESDGISGAGYLDGYDRDATVRSMAHAILVAVN